MWPTEKALSERWKNAVKASEAVPVVVYSFYKRAVTDDIIGYHFRVIERFEEHIPRISAFWKHQLFPSEFPAPSSVNVMKSHRPLGIKKAQVGRWIVLFKQTIDEYASMETSVADDELAHFVERWHELLDQWKARFLNNPSLFT